MKTTSMENKYTTDIQPSKYIYFPFNKKECSDLFLEKIHEFIKISHQNETENKRYKFITYGRKQLTNLPPNTKIYITGLGINEAAINPGILSQNIPVEALPYFISGGNLAISMKTLVERLIFDGILKSPMLILKLWFDDYYDKAIERAEKFKNCLKTHQIDNKFLIDYYQHCNLYFPTLTSNKCAITIVEPEVNTKTQIKKASQLRESLFFNTYSDKYNENTVVQGGINPMTPVIKHL